MLLAPPASALLLVAVCLATVGPVGLYAVAPPAAALLLGTLIAASPVRAAAARPEAIGRVLVLATLPETSVIFGFVTAFTLAGPSATSTADATSLAIVGAAGAVAVAIQALLLRATVQDAVATPEGFGRFLVGYVTPSAITPAAFLWAFLTHQPA